MSTIQQSWLPEAQTLGYESEEQMLRDMYEKQERSIGSIAKVLGFSMGNVRRRLLCLNIELRARGGPNRVGKGKAQLLPDEALENITKESAFKHGLHISAMSKEKRRRRLIDELRAHFADQSGEAAAGEAAGPEDAHDASSVCE